MLLLFFLLHYVYYIYSPTAVVTSYSANYDFTRKTHHEVENYDEVL